MADLLLKDAPDPEAYGKIRFIVRSAHKWGGDGGKPQFRKIRRVLMSQHPEVIAHAFGGNPDVAAAWIKDNWAAMHGKVYPGKTGAGPTYWRGKGKNLSQDEAERYTSWFEPVPEDFVASDDATIELFCAASSKAVEKDGLVWKTALRTGSWKRNPVPGSKGPLVIDKNFLDELVASFEDGAWEHVTVPLSHADKVDENTGYVRKLRVEEDPERKDEHLLKAGLDFTEPDIKGKVKRGSIANVSVGVGFNVSRTQDGKTYKKVLKHIALTNMPWINGLQPFGGKMAASRDAVIAPSYEEDGSADVDLAPLGKLLSLARPAKPKFDEMDTHDALRTRIQHLIEGYRLDRDGDSVFDDKGNRTEDDDDGDEPANDGPDMDSHLYVVGVSDESVLVMGRQGYDGDEIRAPDAIAVGWVFGYEQDGSGNVTIDPVDEWMPVQKTWIRLSQEFDLAIESVWEDGTDAVTIKRNQPKEAAAVAGKGAVTEPEGYGKFPAEADYHMTNSLTLNCGNCMYQVGNEDGDAWCGKYNTVTDMQGVCDSFERLADPLNAADPDGDGDNDSAGSPDDPDHDAPVSSVPVHSYFVYGGSRYQHMGTHKKHPHHIRARKTGGKKEVPMHQDTKVRPKQGGVYAEQEVAHNVNQTGLVLASNPVRGTTDDVVDAKTQKVGVPTSIRVVNKTRGGENMPEETKNTEEVTLSREDLDKIINDRVDAGLNAARESAKAEATAEREALELELSKNRSAVHEMRVKERIAELNAAGHAPALVTAAKEILLADERGETALNLSRDGQDVSLSATDIVLELLAAIPATSLAASQPEVHRTITQPETGEDSSAEGDKLYDELFGKNAKPAIQS